MSESEIILFRSQDGDAEVQLRVDGKNRLALSLSGRDCPAF